MIGKTIAHYQVLDKLGEGGIIVKCAGADNNRARTADPPRRAASSGRRRRRLRRVNCRA